MASALVWVTALAVLITTVFWSINRISFRESLHRQYERPEFDIIRLDEPGSNRSPTGVDIVFVHGLGSNPNKTWGAPNAVSSNASAYSLPFFNRNAQQRLAIDEDSVMWIKDFLLEDLSSSSKMQTRIFMYNYESKWLDDIVYTRLFNLGNHMLHRVQAFIRSTEEERLRPLIFVGHSMGGLVIKKALVLAKGDKQFDDIVKQTRGVLFLGTPHAGSNFSIWGQLVSLLCRPLNPASMLLRELKAGDLGLLDLQRQFSSLINDRLRVVNFFEELKTTIFELGPFKFSDFIVSESSATFTGSDRAVENLGLAMDHRSLNKFSTRGPQYKIVREKLLELMGCINHNDVSHSIDRLDGSKSIPPVAQLRSQSSPKLLEILQSLAFPRMFERRSTIVTPHSGTCKWVFGLEEYKQWRAQSRGLLWIKGKPGAGKSTLMAFLYEELRAQRRVEHGIYLDFFLTARATELQHSILGMLRSLLNQFFAQTLSIRPLLRETYEEKSKSFGPGKRDWGWQVAELETLLLKSVVTASTQQPVTIFVDALDEAGEQAARLIAKFFFAVCESVESVAGSAKVCISSRHYPVPTTIRGLEIWVENHNEADIASFVNSHLGTDNPYGNNHSEQAAWEDLKLELVNQAKGVFQWIHLVLPMVEAYFADGEDIEVVRDWLLKAPGDLVAIYKHILTRVIDPRNRAQSFQLLQWIVLAEWPLSFQELRYALAAKDITVFPQQTRCSETKTFIGSDERMKIRLKALSGGLLESAQVRNSNKETIQVIHKTVKDFLLEEGLRLLTQLQHTDSLEPSKSDEEAYNTEIIQRCHASLYRSSLNHLATENSEGPRSPWLCYAALNLFVHARKSGTRRSESIGDELDLLRRAHPVWVTAYRNYNQASAERPASTATLLHTVCAARMPQLVKYLLENDRAYEGRHEEMKAALQITAREGRADIASILLSQGVDINALNSMGQSPLWTAVRFGRHKLVKFLLGHGAKTEIIPYEGSALYIASERGDTEMCQILLDAGADVNAVGGYHGLALHAASRYGHQEIVRRLLGSGAQVNAQAISRQIRHRVSALHEASCTENTEIVQILLDHGANINDFTEAHDTALDIAIQSDRRKVMCVLVSAGADVNTFGSSGKTSPLQSAYRNGSTGVIRSLLGVATDPQVHSKLLHSILRVACSNADEETAKLVISRQTNSISQADEYGELLVTACEQGFESIARLLLKAGANVNYRGAKDTNPLLEACLRPHPGLIKLLLSAGADPDSQYENCTTALYASCKARSLETVKLLIQAGANVNAPCPGGRALDFAVVNEDVDITRLLCMAKADINGPTGVRSEALHVACMSGQSEMVKVLLDAGAVVDTQQGPSSRSLLGAACIRGDPEIVRLLLGKSEDVHAAIDRVTLTKLCSMGNWNVLKLLLNAGVLVDSRDTRWRRLLIESCYHGELEIAKVLVENGVDVNFDECNETPLYLSCKQGHVAIVKILVDAGADINGCLKRQTYRSPTTNATNNQEEIEKILLEAGAQPDLVDATFRKTVPS